MKFIEKFFKKYEPLFQQGGKYEKMRPAYQAMYTFMFTPDETTKSGAHIRDAVDLKRIMFVVVLALIPATLFGMWNLGFQYFTQAGMDFTNFDAFMYGFWKIMPMIIVSYVVGLGIEFYFAIMRGHEVNEGYLVTEIPHTKKGSGNQCQHHDKHNSLQVNCIANVCTGFGCFIRSKHKCVHSLISRTHFFVFTTLLKQRFVFLKKLFYKFHLSIFWLFDDLVIWLFVDLVI